MTKPTAMVVLFFGYICLPIGSAILVYDIITETLGLIESNSEVVTFSDGTGYGLIMLPFPIVYITHFAAFERFQKTMYAVVIFYCAFALLVTPRVIDHYMSEKLIDSGYTYCGHKRLGSVRYTRRLWLKDPTCHGRISDEQAFS